MSAAMSSLLLLVTAVASSPQQLWPTPLFTDPYTHRALADALREPLLALAEVDGGVQKSNKESNGWHSSDLLDFELHEKLGRSGLLVSSASAVLAAHDAVVQATHKMIVRILAPLHAVSHCQGAFVCLSSRVVSGARRRLSWPRQASDPLLAATVVGGCKMGKLQQCMCKACGLILIAGRTTISCTHTPTRSFPACSTSIRGSPTVQKQQTKNPATAVLLQVWLHLLTHAPWCRARGCGRPPPPPATLMLVMRRLRRTER